MTHPPRVRLHITLQIMCKMKQVLSREPWSYTNIMLWAACSMAFFGFMRVGEFTIPGLDDFDGSSHLFLSDISIDSRENPRLLKVTLKQSKTDPFRKGVNIYLGATDRPICPVLGILPYLTARGNQTGLLFILDNGKGLTRQTFSVLLDSLLSKLHLDTKCFNSDT